MARIGKLRKQLQELENQKNALFCRRAYVQGMNLIPRIQQLKSQIRDIELQEEKRKYEEKVTLRDLLPEDEVERASIHKMLVKVSLASDFLYEVLFELTSKLDSYGILVNSLEEETKIVCSGANNLASKLLNEKAPMLKTVLLDNEPMLDSMNKILNDYVDKTLTP